MGTAAPVIKIAVAVAAVGAQIAMAAMQPPVQGPRLGDLSVSAATYGLPVAVGFGVCRLGGNMIWTNGIKEQSHTSGGKGFGGKQTTFTYSSSFAFAFAAGPCDRILRIWADSKIVYDETGSTSDLGMTGVTLRQYYGTEEQLPDSAIVADKGAANTPAFRGLVYIVAENVPLAGFGNRIPNISAEIAWDATISGSVLVQTDPVPAADNPWPLPRGYEIQDETMTFDFSRNVMYRAVSWLLSPPGGIEVTDLSTMTVTRLVTVQDLYTDTDFPFSSSYFIRELMCGPGTDLYAAVFDFETTNLNYGHFVRISPETLKVTGDYYAIPPSLPRFPPPTTSLALTFSNGEVTRSAVNKNYLAPTGTVFRDIVACISLNRGPVLWDGSNMTSPYLWGAQDTSPSPQPRLDSGVQLDHIVMGAINSDGSCDFWFVNYGQTLLDGTPVTPAIEFYRMTLGVGAGVTTSSVFSIPAADILPATATVCVQRAEFDRANNALILFVGSTFVSNDVQVTSIDAVSGAIRWMYGPIDGTWTYGDGQSILESSTLSVYSGTFFEAGIGTVAHFITLNTSSGELMASTPISGAYGPLSNAFYNSRTQTMYSDALLSRPEAITIRSQGGTALLSDIVHFICIEAGLTADEIDTSALTDQVRGYTHAQEIARNLVGDLSGAFFFDGSESDYVLKFVKRGGSPVLTIPYADALPPSSGSSAALPIKRNQAEDIPRRVWVRYPDTDNNQQQGTQYWSRSQSPTSVSVINSAGEATMDLRIVYNASEAKTLAKKRLLMLWQERDTLTDFGLPPSYMALDPADVVNVTMRDGDVVRVRIEKAAIGADLSCRLSGTVEDATLLGVTATGDGGTGVTPTLIPTPYTPVTVQAEMPLIRDTDDTGQTALRQYGAFGAFSGQTFGGASLYTSVDTSAWSPLMSSTVPMVWGSAINALPAPAVSPWITDNVNALDVAMSFGAATLETATSAQVLEGANPAILVNGSGNVEVIQYTTVTPLGGNVYRLTGLLRGRRGSEWACGLHASGDKFVALDPATWREATVPLGWLNVTRFEKTLGALDVFDAIPAVTHLFQGTAEKPYAPVFVTGTYDGSNNLVLTWVRRTRIGGEWLDGIETVPLSEATESYSVDILSSGVVVRTLTAVTSPTATYTAADQITDGLDAAAKDISVFQISAIVGRGHAGTATIAAP